MCQSAHRSVYRPHRDVVETDLLNPRRCARLMTEAVDRPARNHEVQHLNLVIVRHHPLAVVERYTRTDLGTITKNAITVDLYRRDDHMPVVCNLKRLHPPMEGRCHLVPLSTNPTHPHPIYVRHKTQHDPPKVGRDGWHHHGERRVVLGTLRPSRKFPA